MAFNPKQEYLVVSKDIQIQDFHDYSEEYITRPPYQRKTVWSNKKKQALMDSLFRRYYVPKLVIREVRLDKDKTVSEIIDGQQRITTVQSFYKNEFKLPYSLNDIHSDLGDKYYKDLNTDHRRYIDKEIKFVADVIKNIDNPKNPEHQNVATDIFWRLQQGESLNFMEIAHAKLSSLARNIIVKYSDDITFDFDRYIPVDSNKHKHPFFNLLNKDNKRMEHLKFFTRFLIIEKNDNYVDLGDPVVTEFIDNYIKEDGIGNEKLENEKFVKETLSVLTLIHDIFKNDNMLSEDSKQIKEFGVEYFVISFYILIRYLKKNYVIDEKVREFIRGFFYDFHVRWRKNDSNDSDIMIFIARRQQSHNNLQIRDMILRQLFFEYLKSNNLNLILKDERRSFNESERIAVYRRDKGLCQLCLSEGKNEKESRVSWSEYQLDHIIPHSKGGETIINNGQLLCKYHNQIKGNKIL
ncbi:MAG: HNH endonuclease family protein [Hyphomicrobiales bacterium]